MGALILHCTITTNVSRNINNEDHCYAQTRTAKHLHTTNFKVTTLQEFNLLSIFNALGIYLALKGYLKFASGPSMSTRNRAFKTTSETHFSVLKVNEAYK